MTTSSNPSHQVIGNIYDAAIDPGTWERALNALADDLEGRAAALLIRDFGENPYTAQALSAAYMEMVKSGAAQEYFERFIEYEEQQVRRLGRASVHEILRDDEVGIPGDVLDQRPDYVFLRQHAGIRRRLGCRLNDNQGWFDALTVAFSDNRHRVSDAHIARLRPYLAHLAKSVEMSRTFTSLRSKHDAVLGALNHISVGIVLALEGGEILLANTEAERILTARDGISRTLSNRFACRLEADTAKLNAGIRDAARTAKEAARIPEGHMTIERQSDAHPYLVEVSPIRDRKSVV